MKYHDVVILESIGKSPKHSVFVLLFDYTGGGSKYPESALALPVLSRLAGLEQGAQKLRPGLTYDITTVNSGFSDAKARNGDCTLFGVLASNLSDSIANLIPDLSVLLALEALQQLLPNGVALRLRQRQEKLLSLIGSGILATPGGYAAEQHRGE